MIPIQHFLILSAILFSLGIFGVLSRRSVILVLMSVELMLQAVTINFIAFAVYLSPDVFSGLIFAIFVIVLAAAEVGLALAIILRIFRNKGVSNADEVNLLKW